MASISDYLKNILAARYGKDVRQSIHDAIQQCYYDGKAGSIDLEARQSIEDLDNNKLDKTGDSANNTVTFTSGDSTSPTGWADIVKVASGETHAILLRKFSLAVKNLRYLYKMLGSTDISSISDGTVTGILSFLKSSLDTTNSNLKNKGVIISSEKYSGMILANSFIPETIVLPAGTWSISTSGYVGYNNEYQPFGIGLNSGQKVNGMSPSWVVKLDTQSTIYIWNILGENVTAHELALWAISL